MKKRTFKIAMAAVVAAVAGYVTYQNQTKEVMSELTLANVEALARYELPDVVVECGQQGGPCWYSHGECYITPNDRIADCAFCGYQSLSCTSPCFILD